MRSFHFVGLPASVVLAFSVAAALAEPVLIEVDFGKAAGAVRALNGINRGPIGAGGRVEVIEAHRALGLHSTRTHDSHWPGGDVVDIHAVFPDFGADPGDPASYDFTATDAYLDGIVKTGARIVYRLGESIEHTPVRRHVHPPEDFGRWVEICLGIIRHYNEGWADGFRHGIVYWEIWNEPENRPAMWSGTDEDYLRLYRMAATRIKSEFPHLKVGGPALGASIELLGDGGFRALPFTAAILEECRSGNVPLDFFSWHCYTDNPAEIPRRGHHVRALLDAHGFQATESHLNEWNLLPGNTWSEGNTPEERDDYFAHMGGAAGAAFLATVLAEMQDAPIDVANVFHGAPGPMGLFGPHGTPHRSYFGMLAFRHLLDLGRRVEVRGAIAGRVGALAATNGTGSEGAVLLANYRGDVSTFRLAPANLPAGATREVFLVNPVHALKSPLPPVVAGAAEPFDLVLRAPGIALVVYRAPGGTGDN